MTRRPIESLFIASRITQAALWQRRGQCNSSSW
jgi:hypothetical protein